ncbi:endonuclease/exonuclease/phosphatase family protein [Myroides sp. DF42-4-2]|uniref:endonuclease/exonuclease/phosphatase family protein n=1 Tax=unclassified Myroides TaxID=2642485 RepID=UPI002575AFE7|nr:endonuclease/exonuclease/phosphatase family protein [Myroides sp. DF42-4-2]MDM1408701.1 endonuclease/exonuclease/phosphatase family protein [Myroides sp. DF42-4-2]
MVKLKKITSKVTSLVILMFTLACNSSDNVVGNEKDKEQEQGGGKEEGPKEEAKVLTLMSYNIHIANPPSKGEGFVDIDAIAAVINAENPDVVLLQEVDRFTDRSGKTLDQALTLGAKTNMNYYFAKALNRSNGEYGVAVLTKKEHKLSVKHSLPGAEGTKSELRTIGLVEIEFEEGQSMYVASTHIDHLEDRSKQVQIREMMNFLTPYNSKPIILGADLNMPPTHELWNSLSTMFQTGCMGTCPLTAPAKKPRTTIDYLMMNEKAREIFSVTDYYTVKDDYASDHFPVVMKVEMKK